MEKWSMKIATVIIILIMLLTYMKNIFSIDDVAIYDYGVEKDKSYVVNLEAELYESMDKANEDSNAIFILNPGEEVVVIEREKNYAKVSVKREENFFNGYVNAWYISKESSEIKEVNPYLGIVEEVDAYKIAKEVDLEKYEDKFSGVVKVVAKCNDFVSIKIADFENKIDKYIWVKEKDIESYNSLKINIGHVSSSAKIYKEVYGEEFLSETVNEQTRKKLVNNLVKISTIEESDKHFKIEDKNGNTAIILRSAFLPISSTSEIN